MSIGSKTKQTVTIVFQLFWHRRTPLLLNIRYTLFSQNDEILDNYPTVHEWSVAYIQ